MQDNKCERCGRNMGDIQEPVCHQCETEELDLIESHEFALTHAMHMGRAVSLLSTHETFTEIDQLRGESYPQGWA